MSSGIDQLIITNPYNEPDKHWLYDRESQEFKLKDGRRKSGYWKQSEQKLDENDPGEFVQIDLVNKIRPRVKKWRESGYPNVSPTTKRLLNFWKNPDEREQNQTPFFCQFEAVETAIWLVESLESEKQGINIPTDGEWVRECFKLATGTGKTVVMSMLIAWNILNKVANPRDARFSKNILIVAPGITVKDRLSVLFPSQEDNFYKEFRIVDDEMWKQLLQAKIVIMNWHNLAEKSDPKKNTVLKRGEESNEVFCKRVLKEFGDAKNILVINDEAHHCWRVTESKDKDEKATIWVEGLDKIHDARGILKTYDLSATPFRPSGIGKQEEKLFSWIVYDFGLNDAIESGLVKTPRVAVRDDATIGDDLKSKFFHLYSHVKDDLNRRVDENAGLPDLVSSAISILGIDWLNTKKEWDSVNRPTPPVFIAVTNRKETAARVSYHILNGFSSVQELEDEEKLIRIDQEALEKLESDDGSSKDELQQIERQKFNSVGKTGKPGEQIQCVVGVNMLSEGWDARTVTNILGLRAFTSQLLCEQVVGRGLRRVSYDLNENGLFDAEYVTVFGIPFSFLPVEGDANPKPPVKPKTLIQPLEDRVDLSISIPNVIRISKKINNFIELDIKSIPSLELDLKDCPSVIEIAPIQDSQPRFDKIEQLNLDELAERSRYQSIILNASVRIHETLGKSWQGDPSSHISQLNKLFEKFIESEKLVLSIPDNENKEKFKRILLSQKIQTISEHLKQFIVETSNEELIPIIDESRPWIRTEDMSSWMTSKKTQPIKFSQINNMVIDSKFEAKFGQHLERMGESSKILSWVKNDHLGFKIWYVFKGEIKTYYPDFIIKTNDENFLIIETKGVKTDQDEFKWNAMKEWVIAINNLNFGDWKFEIILTKDDFNKIL
jgi:type III restriction enzyme